MKKYKKSLVLVVIFLLILVITYKQYLSKSTTENNTINQENETQIIFESKEQKSIENLTLLEQYNIDIDEDNEEENIMLYTSAEKATDGEIMWDDGQSWLMLVKDKDREFVLFDEYIQLGELKLWVYTAEENNKIHITTLQPGSASMHMSDYIFDKEKQYFEKKTIFNPKNINMLLFSK